MSAFLRCITFSGLVSLLLLSFVAFFVFPRPDFVVPTLIRVAGYPTFALALKQHATE
jgi:hypothetical protein